MQTILGLHAKNPQLLLYILPSCLSFCIEEGGRVVNIVDSDSHGFLALKKIIQSFDSDGRWHDTIKFAAFRGSTC